MLCRSTGVGSSSYPTGSMTAPRDATAQTTSDVLPRQLQSPSASLSTRSGAALQPASLWPPTQRKAEAVGWGLKGRRLQLQR